MKSAVLSEPITILSADSPNVYVSEPAQRRLDALRSSVEVRLAALEAALADPSRGDALETLILDLARVACEESQAAAVQACADTRLEAEMHIGQARAAAQAAVDQEFASSADVRRLLRRSAAADPRLQHENEEGLKQAREAFELRSLERARRQNRTGAHGREAGTVRRRRAGRCSTRTRADEESSPGTRSARRARRAPCSTNSRKAPASRAARTRRLRGPAKRPPKASVRTTKRRRSWRWSAIRSPNCDAQRKAAEQLATLGRRESEARNSHEHITKVYDETVAELRERARGLRRAAAIAQEAAGAGHADQSAAPKSNGCTPRRSSAWPPSKVSSRTQKAARRAARALRCRARGRGKPLECRDRTLRANSMPNDLSLADLRSARKSWRIDLMGASPRRGTPPRHRAGRSADAVGSGHRT